MNLADPADIVIVMGSARGDGMTSQAVEHLGGMLDEPIARIDLVDRHIQPFRYGDYAREDDFAPLVDALLGHSRIVLVTPVYWYAMSGLMKTMFDRLTDLLLDDSRKPTARALAGRDVWGLSVGTDAELPAGFTEPFVRTTKYFGLRWHRMHYLAAPRNGGPIEPDELCRLTALAAELQRASGSIDSKRS